MKKFALVGAVCLVALPFAVSAAPGEVGPKGFAPHMTHPHHARAPQGFGNDSVATVKGVIDNAADDQKVTLRGRFTEMIDREHYVFVDQKGDKIVCELDDDRRWGHVHKDAPMEIYAEVERDDGKVELEVYNARPIK